MRPMVMPLCAVLVSQLGRPQDQEILSIAAGSRVGEIKTTSDDGRLVNDHHLIVNCKLNHVT